MGHEITHQMSMEQTRTRSVSSEVAHTACPSDYLIRHNTFKKWLISWLQGDRMEYLIDIQYFLSWKYYITHSFQNMAALLSYGDCKDRYLPGGHAIENMRYKDAYLTLGNREWFCFLGFLQLPFSSRLIYSQEEVLVNWENLLVCFFLFHFS